MNSTTTTTCVIASVALLGSFTPANDSWGETSRYNRQRPNVVLIMIDDQGYGDLVCHGNPWMNTPNLDELHSKSVRFTDFHVSPMCSPTRAALLTGRHCRHVGVRNTNNCTNYIAREIPTAADIFAAAGYRTGMFGKWHLGELYPYRPHDRGFQEAYYHGNGAVGTNGDIWGNDYFDDTYWHNGEKEKFTGYCTNVWFDQAMDFMEECRRDGKPFFCYIPTNVVHGPQYVDDRYVEPFRSLKGVSASMAKMFGTVVNLDENIGRLCEFLQSSGFDENTILIFTTDNGTAYGAAFGQKDGRLAGYNAGMRGKKGSSYDGGHRVPFFIRWPARNIGGGWDVDTLAAHIDVLPTLLDLCGLPSPRGVEFDGLSLRPLIEEKRGEWPDRVVVESFRGAVMTQRWRLVGEELYDMRNDPGQKNDVASKHPDVVKRLQVAFERNQAKNDTRQQRPIVGAEQQPAASFTPEHWLDEELRLKTFRLSFVLNGDKGVGEIPIEVASDGVYEISLRRWPKEANQPIRAGIAADHVRPKGKPLPIAEARIKIGGQSASMPVTESMKAATFKLPLKKGEAMMLATFKTDAGETLGAYFVGVRRLATK